MSGGVGTARGLIAWALMLAGFIYLLTDAVISPPQPTGLSVLGVVFLGVALWILRVLTRGFWIRDIPDNHPDALGSLDLEARAHRKAPDQ